MGLLGSLSNQDVQGQLQHLADKLDGLAGSDTKPRHSGRADHQLRSGVVLSAIMGVLSSADRPMRTVEVHKAVTALLARPVAYSSVKARLAGKAQGADARFERTARGRYRLREQQAGS